MPEPADHASEIERLTRLAERERAAREAAEQSLRDEVAQRTAAEERLREMVYRDTLTGLANRSLLRDRLERCVHRSRRDATQRFALLFLDFDGFKVVNDSLGHPVGDQLLVSIAERLRRCLRASDTVVGQPQQRFARPSNDCVARIGGDEFVILLEDLTSPEDSLRVVKRIQNQFTEPIVVGGYQIFATASIGVVTNEGKYHNADDVLRDADSAMYAAKAAGKSRFVIFDQTMHHRAVERLKLESDLRRALDERQFVLVYQPIVRLDSMEVHGFEALLRWRHPTRGEVSPAQFITLAEETGVIVPLGQWALQEACTQLAKWRALFPNRADLSMSVNVSKRQFADCALVEVVREALRTSNLPPDRLRLEVTESIVNENTHIVNLALRQLDELGVQLHMDDFGTGYSSLSCLHQFPLDVLKIDRAFLANLDAGLQFAALLHAVVTLAHNLKMRVTAEGIETDDQLAQVLALECDYGQGYLFSKPLTPEQAVQFIGLSPVVRKSA